VMSKLSEECGAINLSQGFPDFPISEDLIERVRFYMRSGHNQYAPMTGAQPLREAIVKKVEDLYSIRYDPEKEVNTTAGATQGIYTAIQSVIHRGDEVIVFEPAYDSYVPSIELAGGVPVFVELHPPKFAINWETVRKAISPRTRMIIINTPHNPTGSVLTPDDMAQLQSIVDGTDIIILSDEVYEHITFDEVRHESVFRYPRLAERSFVLFSFGKTFHATGWKIGYCMAPENLMAEFRSVHQFLVYCINTPIQLALSDFLKDRNNYLEIPAFYQEKRDLFCELIKDSRFRFTPSSGSYFQIVDYSQITDEKDTDFSVRMTKEYGVASIPVSVFYDKPVYDKVLRFCFAKKDETLRKAAEILCRI
ncbi:methionine aminotransferase, partial [Acidobacteriota bacterium]